MNPTAWPLRFGVQAGGPADAEAWMALARKAEDLGYSALSMADHFDRAMSPVPALAVAATATSTLRLSTIVFGNDFRHPLVVARDMATLQQLSGGRVELGIGAGWMTSDYTESGIPLERAGLRIERLAESVEILHAAYTGESVSYSGEHYEIDDFSLVGFAGTPAPRIMMGGGGPKMLRTAGRLADIVGINPNLSAGVMDERAGPDATLERTEQKLAWVRQAAAAAGRDMPEIQVRVHLALVTDDATSFAEAMAPALGLSAEQAMESPHALVGTVDQIVDKLHRLHADHGLSYFTWGDDTLEPMAAVIEAVRG